MKENLEKLKTLINEIFEEIELKMQIENIDLEEFDADYKNGRFSAEDIENYYIPFRESILFHKNDKSFSENDLPFFEELLSAGLTNLKAVKELTANKYSSYRKPNREIIKLINQNILNTKTKISGTMKGKEFSGFLTDDGFFELNISGRTQKFNSFRVAAIAAWGTDVPSQWKFWKVNDQSLEYYKNLINDEL